MPYEYVPATLAELYTARARRQALKRSLKRLGLGCYITLLVVEYVYVFWPSLWEMLP